MLGLPSSNPAAFNSLTQRLEEAQTQLLHQISNIADQKRIELAQQQQQQQ